MAESMARARSRKLGAERGGVSAASAADKGSAKTCEKPQCDHGDAGTEIGAGELREQGDGTAADFA